MEMFSVKIINSGELWCSKSKILDIFADNYKGVFEKMKVGTKYRHLLSGGNNIVPFLRTQVPDAPNKHLSLLYRKDS